MKKYVYTFFNNAAEGSSEMNNLLGGKGANLAEMTNLKIPVPPGFTITTEACVYFMKHGKYPPGLIKQTNKAIHEIELFMKQKFGDNHNPLLFSIRSGARQSMPGMMETVLNVGLNSESVIGLQKQTKNSNFAYDSYRRLIMMYADVVMEKGDSTIKNLNIRVQLEKILEKIKQKNKCLLDNELNQSNLIEICNLFKKKIEQKLRKPFPEQPKKQLWNSIEAVFKSWNGKRAINYRKIENIPNNWGTAVNIQCMVFGNKGNRSATGVVFTRNPSTGENIFFGEWLMNAQGEDVVAGIRTPFPIYANTQNDLKIKLPKIYKELNGVQKRLEKHYKEMQDIEFTIEEDKLWILQTRAGKRSGTATIKIALDMLKEKILSKKNMLNKINSNHINEVLLPTIDYSLHKKLQPIAVGLAAGPGAATGRVVFCPDEAEQQYKKGHNVILVREETSPEDIHGMFAARAILTSRGGITSHAALVARGWGKCCVVGCKEVEINYQKEYFKTKKLIIRKNDWITLNGSNGHVYNQKIKLIQPKIKKNKLFNELLNISQSISQLKVRTNADNPKDAKTALELGATGIGLCRTEHMFFKPNRIKEMRKMILANNSKERKQAIANLLPFQKNDFYQILKTMNNLPVTIRLLDPPLHEFLPNDPKQIQTIAKELKVPNKKIITTINKLHETNPMLGHRGCRLGITYPEITEMQTNAIIKAVIQLKKDGFNPQPEIMIPLVGSLGEFLHQKNIISNLTKKYKIKIPIGTMIELPRTCLIADQIAKNADFFSFGTNDLTQTTWGFSRDDIGSFTPKYLNEKIIKNDPFHVLDQDGVGELIHIAINKARKIKPAIKIGICGEHGGDPESIEFLFKAGVSYLSCSPFRVPIAYLKSAQLSI